jgi:hypothetical protein
MKLQEVAFLEAVADQTPDRFVRDIAGDFIAQGVAPKQLHYWLEKWIGKGWYKYGVSLDLGWLTEAGRAEIKLIKERWG